MQRHCDKCPFGRLCEECQTVQNMERALGEKDPWYEIKMMYSNPKGIEYPRHFCFTVPV